MCAPINRIPAWAGVLLGVALNVGCAPSVSPLPAPAAQVAQLSRPLTAIYRVEPDPKAGFHWPYYLYVPQRATERPLPLLVLPNNTGSVSDDFAVHEASVLKKARNNRALGDLLELPMLRPVFPRPATHWQAYVHALDRDTLFAPPTPELQRVDLQLLAMIDDARSKLETEGVHTRAKVLLLGFSASGMFVNRFAALHPRRVLAAAIGSPGGWPLAPVGHLGEELLRYPIGVGDLAAHGIPYDAEGYTQLPLLFFQGALDENDSVAFDDSYDEEDRERVNRLFGTTLTERWGRAEQLYAEADAAAEFKLYPGVGHEIDDTMLADLIAFLRSHSKP